MNFLKNFKKKNYSHIGFEPSANVARYSARFNKVKVLNKFFNLKNSKKLKNLRIILILFVLPTS